MAKKDPTRQDLEVGHQHAIAQPGRCHRRRIAGASRRLRLGRTSRKHLATDRGIDVAGPDAATDWAELLAQLEALLKDTAAHDAASERSATLSAEMHAYRDGRNTERVYQVIRARGIPAPKGAA